MLVVDPVARKRAVSRLLTEECPARAWLDRAAALALYLDMGFRLERPLPDRFGVPYGLYVKALDEA